MYFFKKWVLLVCTSSYILHSSPSLELEVFSRYLKCFILLNPPHKPSR